MFVRDDVFVGRICDLLLCSTMFCLSRPDIGCPFEIVRYLRFVIQVLFDNVVHNCHDDDRIRIVDLDVSCCVIYGSALLRYLRVLCYRYLRLCAAFVCVCDDDIAVNSTYVCLVLAFNRICGKIWRR